MNPLSNKIQWYSGNIFDSKPKGDLTIMELLQSMQRPKSNMIDLFEKIRTESDKAKRDKLKTKLVSFTPCCYVDPNANRKYDHIINFTEVAMLDYDGLPDRDYAAGFKQALFDSYEYVTACWLSASGKGVRALIYIPRATSVVDFKQYFQAIEKEFGQYRGFDTAPKNCILPLFYSIDTELLIREDPQRWVKRYTPISTQTVKDRIHSRKTGGKSEWVKSNAEKAIDKIMDNGHPQLRAAAYTVGGYVAGGYIHEDEAIDWMHHLIESNSYLSKKPSVYKRTATEMIKKGQNEPLHFN